MSMDNLNTMYDEFVAKKKQVEEQLDKNYKFNDDNDTSIDQTIDVTDIQQAEVEEIKSFSTHLDGILNTTKTLTVNRNPVTINILWNNTTHLVLIDSEITSIQETLAKIEWRGNKWNRRYQRLKAKQQERESLKANFTQLHKDMKTIKALKEQMDEAVTQYEALHSTEEPSEQAFLNNTGLTGIDVHRNTNGSARLVDLDPSSNNNNTETYIDNNQTVTLDWTNDQYGTISKNWTDLQLDFATYTIDDQSVKAKGGGDKREYKATIGSNEISLTAGQNEIDATNNLYYQVDENGELSIFTLDETDEILKKDKDEIHFLATWDIERWIDQDDNTEKDISDNIAGEVASNITTNAENLVTLSFGIEAFVDGQEVEYESTRKTLRQNLNIKTRALLNSISTSTLTDTQKAHLEQVVKYYGLDTTYYGLDTTEIDFSDNNFTNYPSDTYLQQLETQEWTKDPRTDSGNILYLASRSLEQVKGIIMGILSNDESFPTNAILNLDMSIPTAPHPSDGTEDSESRKTKTTMTSYTKNNNPT